LVNLDEGRHRLPVRDDVRRPHAIDHSAGTIDAAHIRPDGRVWYRQTQATANRSSPTISGAVVLRPAGEPAPRGRPYGSWHFPNEHGQRVNGFLVTPGAAALSP
jgi:hypothetical protein